MCATLLSLEAIVELGISAIVNITQNLGYYQGGAKPTGGPAKRKVIYDRPSLNQTDARWNR